MTPLSASEAEITGMLPSGAGLAEIDGLPVVVPGALLGERVRMEWTPPAPGGRQGLAKHVERLSPSPFLEPHPCPHAGACGGCPLGKIREDAAAKMKRRLLVVDELVRAGLAAAPAAEAANSLVDDVRLQPEACRRGFRNKAVLYPTIRNGATRFGLYRAGTHEVVPAEDCPQSPDWMDAAARRAAKLIDDGVLSIYDESAHSGDVRALLMREGVPLDTGARPERLAALIVREHLSPERQAAVLKAFEGLALESLCVHAQPERGNAVLSFAPGATVVLAGKPAINAAIDGLTFSVQAETFLQVNTPQTEVLYGLVMEALELEPEDAVLDLYCGIGTMTLMAAKRAPRGCAVGVELVEASVASARANARRNSIENVLFFAGPVEKVLPTLPAMPGKTLKAIVDPAYKGLADGVAQALAARSPERIVYVACSPKHFARDAKRFEALGYEIERVTPVDLFPGAMHLETVGLLKKRGPRRD